MLTKRTRAPSANAKKILRAYKKAKTAYTLIKAPVPKTTGRHFLRKALTYFEAFTLDPSVGGGVAAAYVLSANGLYDPNITGIGHQPTGFDQLMAIYGDYCVVKSTIKVSAVNADSTVPAVICLSIQSTSGTTTQIGQYIENQDCVWKNLGLSSASSIAQLSLTCDMRKQANQDVYNESSYSGDSTANPAIQKYYHIAVCAADFTSNLGAVYVNVQIDYDVYFRDQKLNTLS